MEKLTSQAKEQLSPEHKHVLSMMKAYCAADLI